MSNKPKIYAFCAAGCKWETVHMSDFLKSATFYEVGQPDGVATVDAYRKYRIFADKGETNYNVTISFQSPVNSVNEEYYEQTTIPVAVGRRGYFDFEILEATYTSAGTVSAELKIVYEVNGVELTHTASTVNYNLTYSVLKITGADQVLRYNDTAAILAKDGVTPVFEVDEVETLPAYQNAYVYIDNSDPEHPRISFGIPRGYDGTGSGGGDSGTTTATDGGYYAPSVVDNNDGTMTISFTASKEGMEAVDPVIVHLPAGKTPVKGTDYMTPDDITEIVEQTLEAMPAAEEVSL